MNTAKLHGYRIVAVFGLYSPKHVRRKKMYVKYSVKKLQLNKVSSSGNFPEITWILEVIIPSLIYLHTYWTAIIRFSYQAPPYFWDLVTCYSRITILGNKFVSSLNQMLGLQSPFTGFFQERLWWECTSTEAPMAKLYLSTPPPTYLTTT